MENQQSYTPSNSKNKFYFSFIIAILALILGLFYYLNEHQNIFKIKGTKYEIFSWLVLLAFSIYTLYFFIQKRDLDSNNYSYKLDSTYLNMFKNLGMLFLIILFPLLIINFILYLHKTNNNVFNITQNILGVLIVIIIFAIVAKLLSIKQTSNEQCSSDDKNPINYILCILKNIIFFIPCLLIILVDEINKDIKLTPSSVYLLFFILLILITLIFVLPLLFTYLAKQNKNDVLAGEGPFYLNQKKTLGKYQNLDKNSTNNIAIPKFNTNSNVENKPSDNNLTNILSILNTNSLNNRFNEDASNENTSSENTSNENIVRNEYYKTNENISDNTKGYDFKLFQNDLNGQYNIGTKSIDSSKRQGKFPYNYTYSISFYIYINPQPTNTSIAYTKDTELFNYGFKPVIYYNGKSRKIIIKSRTINNKSDQLDTIYEMTNVKHQKWVYFVINYENNIIDVFIDGKLVGSKNNVTPYFVGDSVTIGENDGIHGSIKEIFYFDKIKTPDSIQFLYSLTKNKNSI
jgi:hypothetical protein